MSIFQKFHEFYKKNIFTDLEICVINTSNFQIQSVCNCHCLIIASLLPQTREILTSNSDESIQIILEDYEALEIKEVIDNIYQSLEYGIDPTNEILNEIFALNSDVDLFKGNFYELERSVKRSRKEISYDVNLFEYDSIEEILQADNKYLSVQLEQPSVIDFSCDTQFCSTFAVSRKNGQNIAALVSSRIEYESLAKDRYCLNLLDVLSRLFEVPLATIFENESILQYFNHEEMIQDQFRFLQGRVTLRLEQLFYTCHKDFPQCVLENFYFSYFQSHFSMS